MNWNPKADLEYLAANFTARQVRPNAELCEAGRCASYCHCFISHRDGGIRPVCAKRVLAEIEAREDMARKPPAEENEVLDEFWNYWKKLVNDNKCSNLDRVEAMAIQLFHQWLCSKYTLTKKEKSHGAGKSDA